MDKDLRLVISFSKYRTDLLYTVMECHILIEQYFLLKMHLFSQFDQFDPPPHTHTHFLGGESTYTKVNIVPVLESLRAPEYNVVHTMQWRGYIQTETE